MKIVLVSNGFPPTSYGGVEAYTFDLAKGLTKRGHEVAVFCRESAPATADYAVIEDKESPFRVYRVVNDFKMVESFSKLYADARIDLIFEKFLNIFPPDLVHYNHFIALSSNLPKITLKNKIPSVISLHDYWPICHRINLINAYKKPCPGPLQGADCFNCVFLSGERGSGVRNLLFFYLKQLIPYSLRIKLRQKIRRPGFDSLLFKARREDFVDRNNSFHEALACGNYLTAPSQFVQQMYVRNGYQDINIHVLPLGIEELTRIPREGHKEKINFAYIGTLLTVKGIDLLIKAFRAVPQQNIQLSIFGREDVEPHYTKHIHEIAQSDPRIIFRGPFPREKRPDIYKEIDVLVIPSITSETFSFVAREALKTGIPVVASELGALPEIIQPGKNGFLFPAGNISALKNIIERFAQDSQLITSLNCPGDVEMLSIEEHIAQIENIYLQIL